MHCGERTTARLFPLRGVVLFPQCVLPLHIFEPRYRLMAADALAGDRRLAMALPVPGSDPELLHDTICIGRIANEVRLPDGRFTFLLHGETRARILGPAPQGDRLYHSAVVEALSDTLAPAREQIRQVQRGVLTDLFRRLAPAGNADAQRMSEFLASGCGGGTFADVLAYAAPLPVEVKQCLLANESVDARLEILCDALPRVVPAAASAPSNTRVGRN